MRNKKMAKRIAVAMLAAATTFSSVPATVFAATSAEVSADDAQTTNQAKMQADVNAALAYIVTSPYATESKKDALGTNSTKTDVENAIQYALTNEKGDGTSDLTGANYTATILGDITKGDIDTTQASPVQAFKFNLQVKYATSAAASEIHNYAVSLDVPVVYTDLTSAQKVDIIGAALKKAAEAVSFSATGEPDASLVKNALNTAFGNINAGAKSTAANDAITYTYTVNNIAGGSTESTTTAKGAVTGTITVKAPAVASDTASKRAAQDAVSKDFTYSASRDFNTASLTNEKLGDIITAVEEHSFANDATSEDIAAFANKSIQTMSASDTTWQGITATVGGLTRVSKQKHDDSSKGSFTATITLTDGTNTLANTFQGKMVHADSEKLNEMDAALTKAASEYKITKLQTANQTTPANEKAATTGAVSVETTIKDIIKAAIDSKPETTKALLADGWNKTEGAKVYGAGSDTSEANKGKTVSRDAIKIAFVNASDTSYTAGSDKKADASYMAPNEIDATVTYTRATAEKEGKIVADITYAVADDSGDTTKVKADDGTTLVDATKTTTKKTTITLTVPKLKAKADTYLRFKDDSKTWVYNSTYPQNVAGTDENSDEDNTYKFNLDQNGDLIRNGNDELVWTSSNPKLTDSIVVNSDNTYIFKDVQDSSKYYFAPVYWGARHTLVSGVQKDMFGVGEDLTRAQMITFLWKAAGKPTVASGNSFTDVPKGSFYENAVNWAVAEGITSGTTATTFSPDKALTRAQAVTFLYRVYGNGEKYTATKSSNFSDVSEKSFYFNAVNWAVKYGITAGSSATKFSPDDTCVREQGVTFLYRTVGPKGAFPNDNLKG